jgi:hypothetical protein
MKRILLIAALLAFAASSIFAQESSLNSFTITGFYQKYENAGDHVQVSFNWHFSNNTVPADNFKVYVWDDGEKRLVLDMDKSEFAPANIRLGYAFTGMIDLEISDINSANPDYAEFFSNPTYSFLSVVSSADGSYSEEGDNSITFTEPKCTCYAEDDGIELKVNTGDKLKTKIVANHANSSASIKFEVRELNDIVKRSFEGYEYPKGITIDQNTGEVEYLAEKEGDYAFMAVAIDNEGIEYNSVITFEVEVLSSVIELSDKGNYFPNPANDVVNVKEGVKVKGFRIYDVNGQMVKEVKSGATSFEVSGLPVGMYFIMNGEEVSPLMINR